MYVYSIANGEDIMRPIKTLGRRYIHIWTHTTDASYSLSTYFMDGCKFNLNDSDVRVGLKFAAEEKNYPAHSIPIAYIDTHSLRAGGTNSFSLNGYADRAIQQIGRWQSDTPPMSILQKVYFSSVLACPKQ